MILKNALRIYEAGRAHAAEHGIILADTKGNGVRRKKRKLDGKLLTR